MLFFLPLLSLLTPTLAQSFSGPGTIAVWNSSDSHNGTPEDKVGCLSATGRFIPISGSSSTCGIFTPLPKFPYTLSSTEGDCTFRDKSQEQNTESWYGGSDYAFYCSKETVAESYDGLYTISGSSYPFLCNGDVNCYYDAKRIPAQGQTSSLWPFRWGSHQIGITPGHVMLQLVWEGAGKVGKRGDMEFKGRARD